jgi:hypothetical protein
MAEQSQIPSPLTMTGVPKYISFVFQRYFETAVWTFAELGVADLLAAASGPQTADELARSQGWNSECLYRILRAVADADIVREIQSDERESIEPEKTNRFELTEDGRLLMSDNPSKARYMLRWVLGPLTSTVSNYLPQIVRNGYANGNGMDQISGHRTLFDYLKDEENRELSHCFDESMTGFTASAAQLVANAFDFSQFSTLADIGSNLGALLSAILAKYPTIKQGICFDLPHIVQQPMVNREFEQLQVPKDRYQFVGGDMFDAQTIPQADAYILQAIVHDWNDEQCINLFKAIKTATNGQRRTLLIVGFVILPQNANAKRINYHANGFDIQMMAILGAKERTEKQHQHLLEQSGFAFKRLHRTETPFSIIEATVN